MSKFEECMQRGWWFHIHIADVILGGWTGAVLCLFGLVRNNRDFIEQRLRRQVDYRLVSFTGLLLAFIVGALTRSWMLIVFSEAVYTVAMQFWTGLRLEIILAVDLLCWFIYDLSIHSYPMAVADLVVFVDAMLTVNRKMQERQVFRISVRESGGQGAKSAKLKRGSESIDDNSKE